MSQQTASVRCSAPTVPQSNAETHETGRALCVPAAESRQTTCPMVVTEVCRSGRTGSVTQGSQVDLAVHRTATRAWAGQPASTACPVA